jgi:hypothetical protein
MTRQFIIRECGDPYSKAWDAYEVEDEHTWFCGDISGCYLKHDLIRYLRRRYPGCKITVEG